MLLEFEFSSSHRQRDKHPDGGTDKTDGKMGAMDGQTDSSAYEAQNGWGHKK